jgi:hypothetical protein
MLEIFLGAGFVVSLGVGGYGMKLALDARQALEVMRILAEAADVHTGKLAAQVKDLQSILTAAPPDMIGASIMASEWKAAMLALPDGSPKRQAYEARLKQLGVS